MEDEVREDSTSCLQRKHGKQRPRIGNLGATQRGGQGWIWAVAPQKEEQEKKNKDDEEEEES
jgi:hypothetical protein